MCNKIKKTPLSNQRYFQKKTNKSNHLMKVFLLCISLFLCGISNATTFYISPNGNDANTGSITNPWKTLRKATSTVNSPGDIIHVNAGTYLETQQCFLAAGVNLEGEGNTSVLQTTWSWSYQGLLVLNSPIGTNGNQSVSYLKFDGRNESTPRGIEIQGRSHVNIHHCTIVDFDEEGIIFNGEVSFTGLPPSIYAVGNTFHDNILTNCSKYAGFGTGCLGIGGQQDMLIYNNTITQLQRTAPEQIGWPIKYYNEGWLKGVKIYNNIVTKAPFNGEGWNFSMELFNQQGMEIYGNTIQGSLDFNYQSKGTYAYSVYIHDNTITEPSFNPYTESGIIIEYGFDGFWIEKNIFKNLSTGVSFYSRPDAVIKDFKCNSNLFANVGMSNDGVGFFIGGLGVGAPRYYIDGFQVLNNTFAGIANNKPSSGINLGDNYGGYTKNIDIRNNTFENVVVSCVKAGGNVAPDNVKFTHNNVLNCDQYNINGNLPSFGVPPTNYSLSNNIHVSPLFVGGGNYTLQPSSPLIDAGINVGFPYNGTAPDIGYAEYAGGGNIPPTANAGVDQTIILPISTASLTGSGSDVDGTITTYLWTKISGTGGSITTPSAVATTITGLTQGVYVFRLTVTDNLGATGFDDVQITVNAGGGGGGGGGGASNPTANAGTNQVITLPVNTVNLIGTGTPASGTSGTNYILHSGVLTNAVWVAAGMTLTNNQALDLAGNNTLELINMPAATNDALNQVVTGLTPGTVYYFSWDVKRGSATNCDYEIYDYTNFTVIRSETSYYSSTSANVGRVEFSFTTPAGCTSVRLGIMTNSFAAGTIYLGRVQLSKTPNDNYVETTTAPIINTGNGVITSYLWTKVAGPAAGTITNTATAATAVTGLVQGTYQFELRVTDNNGAVGKDTMQVTVNPAGNIPPTANAGADQTITLPTNTANLSGSGTDPDGTVVSYLWTKVAGPAGGTITNASSATTTVTGFTTSGVYRFELKVTDNNGSAGRDTMQVTVNPSPNIAPTANAGVDINITLPTNTVNLSGSGTDPDGTITSYLWTKVSGPIGGGGNITNANAASTTVTAFIQGVYKFELRVTDNNGAVGRDTVQVAVFASNILPTANAGLNQSMTLPTNTATLNGSGNDVDGIITAYRWTRVGGPAIGAITNAAAAVTTITGLAAGVYLFELQVTDNSGATGRDTVQITVNPENIPPVANAGPDQTVALPTNTVTLSGSGTDIDGTVVAYAWKQLSGPVDKLTSLNTAITIVDNLVEGVYTFELTVTDNRGATDKDSVTVAITAAAFAKQNTAKIYPNPVVNVTTLQVNSTNDVSTLLIVITDLQGKMVYQKQLPAGNGNTKERIDMSTLSSGSYFVTVYFNNQQKQTLKIIKQ
jgi:hypothetical protein